MTRKYLAIATLLFAPLGADATTWTLGSSVPAGITSIKAYSAGTGTASTFSTASWNYYASSTTPYGMGVTTSGESTNSPEHAVDNVGNIEALLFQFDKNTILEKLSIGWPSTTSTYDSDITVLRYTGSGAPSQDRDIDGETTTQLIGRGWQNVGVYNLNKGTLENINSGGLASSYWLISAYSSNWGTTLGGETGQVNNGNDYFKLTSLVGTAVSTIPGVSVPEPTSLLLLAGGMLGWRLNRKNQALAA